MELKVKDMDIATGGVQVVILNKKDAEFFDLHPMDRLLVRKKNRSTVAVLDIAESEKAVPVGRIGLFEEVLDALRARHNDKVEIALEKKPASVSFIRKKLDGKELDEKEIYTIVKDIVESKLTDIELTSYVTANYTHGMSRKETVALTHAMTTTGSMMKLRKFPVFDIHSIGGVPGNRTTIVVVPILAAAGVIVPKTSSRAITSPAGTADTMEVLCKVSLSLRKLKSIINKVGAFIVWGGAVNLAPADDRIITVEHPLSIDAEGQMLASIMAKKASVSATHLLMEIPIGAGTKVESRNKANHLKKEFEYLCKQLGIKIKTLITDGSQPIGNGIGPALEARDCLLVLKNDRRAPKDLKQKSLAMAGIALEFAGKCRKGHGFEHAKKLLRSGAAYRKMIEIITAQGGRIFEPEKLRIAKHGRTIKAGKSGKIVHIDNIAISKVARIAGAPVDPGAGIYFHRHKGDRVKKGDRLFTIYSEGHQKLEYALDAWKEIDGVVIR